MYAGTEQGVYRLPDQRVVGDLDVRDVAVMADGALIIGTLHAGELFRYADGQLGSVAEGSFEVFAPSPEDPEFVLAGSRPVGMAATHDGGRRWHYRSRIHNAANNEFPDDHYVRALTFSPKEPDIVYAGIEGLDEGGVLRSRNGGKTWVRTSLDRDIHALVCPKKEGVVYAASGAGFFVTEDHGEDWRTVMGGLLHKYPMCLTEARDGSLYMGVAEDPPPYWDRVRQANAALYRLPKKVPRWERVMEPDQAAITAVTAAPDGRVYVGRADGLVFAGSEEGFQEHAELPSRITSLTVD
ncbi:MAG: hypothetical protein R6W82_06550 [bacterium]